MEVSEEYTNTDEFLEEYKKLAADSDDFYILQFCGTFEADGTSWCGDCVVAKPVIANVIANTTAKKMLRAAVTRAEWRGNAEHPYKKHPILQVAGVPTLLLCKGDTVMCRADDLDEHFANEGVMEGFIDLE